MAISAAILLDATLVRLVMLPAILLLVGDRVWWPTRRPRPMGQQVVEAEPEYELVWPGGTAAPPHNNLHSPYGATYGECRCHTRVCDTGALKHPLHDERLHRHGYAAQRRVAAHVEELGVGEVVDRHPGPVAACCIRLPGRA